MLLISLIAVMPANAPAQTPTYGSPLYTSPDRSGLDPNYGMPSFGTKGNELPSRPKAAPRDADGDKNDIFARKPGSSDGDLRAGRQDGGSLGGMETPTYTTGDNAEMAVPPSYDSSNDTK
jgi:hypothetical protein